MKTVIARAPKRVRATQMHVLLFGDMGVSLMGTLLIVNLPAWMNERKLGENIFFISLDVGDKSRRDKSLEKSLPTVCVCVF